MGSSQWSSFYPGVGTSRASYTLKEKEAVESTPSSPWGLMTAIRICTWASWISPTEHLQLHHLLPDFCPEPAQAAVMKDAPSNSGHQGSLGLSRGLFASKDFRQHLGRQEERRQALLSEAQRGPGTKPGNLQRCDKIRYVVSQRRQL